MKALRYTTQRVEEKMKLVVTISLADDCKNGVCDFSITCEGYRKAKNGRWVWDFGGCCHDEISKYFPQFRDFINLHNSNSFGQPMYAVENGFYFLKESRQKCAEYLRISEELANKLCDTDKDYFKYQLWELGIVDNWKAEADRAIEHLENLCGYKFEDYETPNTNFSYNLTFSEIDEMKKRIAQGYYDTPAIKERAEREENARREKKIAEIVERAKKKIDETCIDRDLDIALIRMFGTDDNVIFYSHLQEICFNWHGNYGKIWTDNEIRQFAKETDFARFKITNAHNPIN